MTAAIVRPNGDHIDCYTEEGNFICSLNAGDTITNAYISGDKIIANRADGRTDVFDRESLNYRYTI